MRLSVLASSSSGNSILVENKTHKFLVDAGLTGKKIVTNLEKINRDIKDIDAIFVTHEHVDHIRGIGVLARKYNIPIYANKETWANMKGIGEIKSDVKFHFAKEESKIFGSIVVNSFGVSHDAVNPQFYTFESEGERFSILTDTGYISEKMIDYVKDSHTIVYESNHEENILLSGPYPWKTKQRILSDKGHLSNIDSANYLTKIIGDKTKNVFLAHLSQQNNTKDLAYMTAKSILTENDIDCNARINLQLTDPEEPSEIVVL